MFLYLLNQWNVLFSDVSSNICRLCSLDTTASLNKWSLELLTSVPQSVDSVGGWTRSRSLDINISLRLDASSCTGPMVGSLYLSMISSMFWFVSSMRSRAFARSGVSIPWKLPVSFWKMMASRLGDWLSTSFVTSYCTSRNTMSVGPSLGMIVVMPGKMSESLRLDGDFVSQSRGRRDWPRPDINA